jgi:hypothetical protein
MSRLSPGTDPFRSADENQISIQVENLSAEDMMVMVLGTARHHDLGRINSRSTARFAVPWSRSEQIRVQIEPTTGSPHTVSASSVEPGDHLELVLNFPASRSVLRR